MEKINKKKVSQLPEASSINGFYAFGTDNNNNSVKVPIDLLKGNKGDIGEKGDKGEEGNNIAHKTIFNISAHNQKYDYEDATTARNAIPETLREIGQIITYQLASEKWITEQYIGADTSSWDAIFNWTQNPAKEDLDSKVNITDLPLDSASKKDYGNETVSGKTGGDTNIALYVNYPIEGKGTLTNITVSLATNTTITPYAVSIINDVYTILHTYKSITGIAGTNLYVIDDAYKVPEGAYISLLYGSNNAAIYNNLSGHGYRIDLNNNAVSATTVQLAIKFSIEKGYSVAKDILTLSQANNLYEPKGSAGSGENTVKYNGVSMDNATQNNGDFAAVAYANDCARLMYGDEILTSVTINAFAAGTIFLSVVSISGTSVNTLHTYPSIQVKPGISTYKVDDTYKMPVATYLMINSSANNTLFFVFESGVQQSYRRTLNSSAATRSHAQVAYNFTTIAPTSKKEIRYGKTILYGDSILSADYPWNKSEMEKITGGTVYNGGFSGFSTASLAKNAQLQRIFDYNPNLIIAMVGGNDTGKAGSIGTFDGTVAREPVISETDISVDYNGTYYIQAVSHIIRKVKAYYYDIRERANLTGSETDAEKEAKIDAVIKPYFVFCSGLPQKRNNDNSDFSKPENWERKRLAVVECCKKYGVECIDISNLLNWDMSIEPFWISPTNMANNRGTYTMDGLHPNKYGYQQIAFQIGKQLVLV